MPKKSKPKTLDLVITPALLIALVNAVVFLIRVIPQIIEIIQGSNMDEDDKDVLIEKIREAQESVPEWK
jgi:hypothetical protein